MNKKISCWLITTLFLFTSHGCNNSQTSKNNAFECYVFTFDNNNNPSAFGFEYYDNDESVGPKSIFISDQHAYIVDTYYSNIKKVNLITGVLEVSDPLGNNRAWLRDIIEFNDNLYILTDLRDNYILDTNLNIVKTFELPYGSKYALGIEKDYLLIYFSGNIVYLNQNGEIIKEISEYHNVFKTVRGKEYHIEDEYINTEYGKFFHSGTYTTTSKYYDSINLDFNRKYLVFFVVDKDSFKLYVLEK